MVIHSGSTQKLKDILDPPNGQKGVGRGSGAFVGAACDM